MKLQFKHQKFQADAAKAVVDVFAGQPYLTPTYMIDKGRSYGQGDFLCSHGTFGVVFGGRPLAFFDGSSVDCISGSNSAIFKGDNFHSRTVGDRGC